MPATLAPVLRHSVECGICGAVAECRANTTLRGVAWDPYLGAEVVDAGVALALPAGWALRDFVHEICFVCESCSLDKTA